MKPKTFKVVLEVGVPIFVGYLPNTIRKKPELVELITLDSYKVTGGVLKWSVTLRQKEIYQGGLLDKVDIGKGLSITPTIPVILHKRWNGLAITFNIFANSDLTVKSLASIKNKYLKKSPNLLQAVLGNDL